MDPTAERRRRIQQSPQQWASDVAAAIPAVLPQWDCALRAGADSGQGVQLLSVRGTPHNGRPVLHVVYRHPWWTFTTGLRRWLDTDDHSPAGDPSLDPARQLAIALVRDDIERTRAPTPTTSSRTSDGTWWWGDEPLPGERHRQAGDRPTG